MREYNENSRMGYTFILVFAIFLSVYNFSVIIPKNGPLGFLIAIISGGLVGNCIIQMQRLKKNESDQEQAKISYSNTRNRLWNLIKLFEEGLISKNEYEKKRQEIIETDI